MFIFHVVRISFLAHFRIVCTGRPFVPICALCGIIDPATLSVADSRRPALVAFQFELECGRRYNITSEKLSDCSAQYLRIVSFS